MLDVACGKAELLLRLVERFGIDGTGVDVSPYAPSQTVSIAVVTAV